MFVQVLLTIVFAAAKLASHRVSFRVHLHVSAKIQALPEGALADVALERQRQVDRYVQVGVFMHEVVRRLGESLEANVAFVGSFAGVNLLVGLELVGAQEAFRADGTVEGLLAAVRLHVRAKVFLVLQLQIADGATYRFIVVGSSGVITLSFAGLNKSAHRHSF